MTKRNTVSTMAITFAAAAAILFAVAPAGAATFSYSNGSVTAGADPIGSYNALGAGGAYGFVRSPYPTLPGNFGIELDHWASVSSITIDQYNDASRRKIENVTIFTSPTTSFSTTLANNQGSQTINLPGAPTTNYVLVRVDSQYVGGADVNLGIQSFSAEANGPALTNLNAGIAPTAAGIINPIYPATRATDGTIRSISGTAGVATYFNRANAGTDWIQVDYAEPELVNSIGVGFDSPENRDLPVFATLFYDGGSEQIDFAGDFLNYGRYDLGHTVETNFLRLEFPDGNVANWFDHGDTNWGLTEFQAFHVPVPEPHSIAIWSILGLFLAGYGYRRRRNS